VTPSTFFTEAPMEGRLYGEGEEVRRFFAVGEDEPELFVMSEGGQVAFKFGTDAAVLVQIFEQPDVLWLVRATTLQGVTMLVFIPLKPLECLDGRSQPPELAPVDPGRSEQARLTADEARRFRHDGP
jgi:hypothetical protein